MNSLVNIVGLVLGLTGFMIGLVLVSFLAALLFSLPVMLILGAVGLSVGFWKVLGCLTIVIMLRIVL